jgi:hypothetical protein
MVAPITPQRERRDHPKMKGSFSKFSGVLLAGQPMWTRSNTNGAMKMVSATTSQMARGPTRLSASREVLIPSAATAIGIHQRDASPRSVCTGTEIRRALFSSTMPIKATRNSGIRARRLPPSGRSRLYAPAKTGHFAACADPLTETVLP